MKIAALLLLLLFVAVATAATRHHHGNRNFDRRDALMQLHTKVNDLLTLAPETVPMKFVADVTHLTETPETCKTFFCQAEVILRRADQKAGGFGGSDEVVRRLAVYNREMADCPVPHSGNQVTLKRLLKDLVKCVQMVFPQKE